MVFKVIDVNEKPSRIQLAPQDIDLKTQGDVRIGDFSTEDPDTKPEYLGHTYKAVSGDGMQVFKVATCDGKPCLKTKKQITGDPGAISIDIRSCDAAGLCRTQPVYVRLNKPNQRPHTPTVEVLNPTYKES
eukprot:UC4_evm1s840